MEINEFKDTLIEVKTSLEYLINQIIDEKGTGKKSYPIFKKRYLTKNEVAELYGVSPRTINKWMSDRVIPYSMLPGGQIRFSSRILVEWMNKRTINSLY